MELSPTIFFKPDMVLTIAQRTRGAPWRLGLAHARSEHVLIWVTRGAAQALVGGQPIQMSSHNALLIPAGTLFSFNFEVTCFGQTVVLPSDAPILIDEAPQLVRVREPKEQLELTGHIEAIQAESLNNKPYADAAVTAHAQLMSVWFSRYRDANAPTRPPKTTAARRLIEAFCALVVHSERTAMCGAPMADFAAKLGVTPTHLTRVCKAECGVTASELLTQHSLQMSLRALEQSRASAASIAERLGFSSPAYFTRFISSHTGKTPSQLRGAT